MIPISIPQCNPKTNYLAHKQEIDAAVMKVLESGHYILGREVALFEREFASFSDISQSVSCANGTDALELIIRSLGIGAGDEVVTVANTAVATVSAIERTGAKARFTDIDPETFTMSPESLTIALRESDKIKAVIPVHLFGCPADIFSIKKITDKNKIYLIEDCAQAHGAEINGRKVGTFGIAGSFSFYPTKNLGALGDGGAIITDSAELADKVRSLRQYGWGKRYISESFGINSRLDELQAAILRVKLRYLSSDNRRRSEIAEHYRKELSSIPNLTLPSSKSQYSHVYHQYVIMTEQRDSLKEYLVDKGINTALHYPVPIHKQPAYLEMNMKLSVTEKVNDDILSLPIFPELTEEQMREITDSIKLFFI